MKQGGGGVTVGVTIGVGSGEGVTVGVGICVCVGVGVGVGSPVACHKPRYEERFPPALLKVPPTYTSLPLILSAWTVLSVPLPRGCHVLPSHFAMRLVGWTNEPPM